MTNKAPSAKAQEQALLQKLLQVPVFTRLPAPYLQLFLKSAKPKALKEGEVVWRQAEASKGLYILLKGQLRIVAEGKYDHPVQPIAALGEVNALTRLPYTDQVSAVESSVLLEVAQALFEQLMLTNINVCQLLCRNIINIISDKLQAANERISQAEGDRQGLAQRIKDAARDRLHDRISCLKRENDPAILLGAHGEFGFQRRGGHRQRGSREIIENRAERDQPDNPPAQIAFL